MNKMITNKINTEKKVMNAFDLENIKNQLNSLMGNNKKKLEAFKTRIVKMGLMHGLDKCSPESIINCGLQAITLDLPLEAGQGYIVAYKGKAQLDVGYKGWQILAKRAGYSVMADVVYSCDDFNQVGFGFGKKISFNPNFVERKSSDDQWAKQNLIGVIVSVREDTTGSTTIQFVDKDMINKITGASPSAGKQNKYGSLNSPHDKWAEQMFAAKAIKQVLSKLAIDLNQSSQLNDAIEIVNNTEQEAQKESEITYYPQDRFEKHFPQWKKLVETGQKSSMQIITQMSNSQNLTPDQLEKIMELRNCEPIEGEAEFISEEKQDA